MSVAENRDVLPGRRTAAVLFCPPSGEPETINWRKAHSHE
jgi:hypothetical protein